MRSSNAMRVQAALFALCAGVTLARVAGIDLADRHAVLRVLVLLVATMQIGETAWRFIWAAEDGERLAPYLPVMVLAAGVPVAIALHLDRFGLAVGVALTWASILACGYLTKADRAARDQAVAS